MATQFTNNSFLMQPGSGDQSASPYGNPLQSYMRLLGQVPGLDANLVANLLTPPFQGAPNQAGMQPPGAGSMAQPDYQSAAAPSFTSRMQQFQAPTPAAAMAPPVSPASQTMAMPSPQEIQRSVMAPPVAPQPMGALAAAAPRSMAAAVPQAPITQMAPSTTADLQGAAPGATTSAPAAVPQWVQNIPDVRTRERLSGIFGGYPSGQGVVNPRLAVGLKSKGYSIYGTPTLQNIDQDLALAQERAKLAEDEKFSPSGQNITQSDLYRAKVNLAMTRGLDQDLRKGNVDLDQAKAIQELYSPRNPVSKLEARQAAYNSALNDFMKAYESGNIELARSMAPGVLTKQKLVNRDQAKLENIKNTLSDVDWSKLEFSKYIGGGDSGAPPLYSQGSVGNQPIDVQAILGALPKTGP